MVKLFRVLSKSAKTLVRKTKGAASLKEQSLDLSAVHHGYALLPKELIDHIMEMLRDDIQALKACSLTCKAMFASTRPLIHRTLYLTTRNNQRVLSRAEKFRHQQGVVGLRFLPYMAEHNLLQYTRRVHINMPDAFTPDVLLPQLHYFQSVDRVHTLVIERYDAVVWVHHYRTCFVHLYSTLTSLSLVRPMNHYRQVLQFALQFPNLENLCLEWLEHENRFRTLITAPSTIDQSPPLDGHLRLAGDDTVVQWPIDLSEDLPNGINFRSVEIEDFFGSRAQHMVNMCANTLEEFTIVPSGTGYLQLHNLKLTQVPLLRRLTLRMVFSQVGQVALRLLPRVISTITSTAFREFVLEIGEVPTDFVSPSGYWGEWGRVDRFLWNRFSDREGFQLVIRTGELHHREAFQSRARETFSLLASRGYIRFETSPSVGKLGS